MPATTQKEILNFINEFPMNTIPDEIESLINDGVLKDESDRNNVCPSFSVVGVPVVRVWVDISAITGQKTIDIDNGSHFFITDESYGDVAGLNGDNVFSSDSITKLLTTICWVLSQTLATTTRKENSNHE